MSGSRFLIFAAKFLLVFGIPAVAFKSFTFQNHITLDRAYKRLEDLDWLECIQECSSRPACISYNFCRQRQRRSNSVCELNNCGFVNQCGARVGLVYSVGCVFQQIREITQTAAALCTKNNNNMGHNTNSKRVLGNFTCIQTMTVYADERVVTKEIDCGFGETGIPITLSFPSKYTVIAIKVTSTKDHPLIRGALPHDVITNRHWKCSSQYDEKWFLISYHDTHWQSAREIALNGTKVQGIPPAAQWIGSDSPSNTFLFCRFTTV